jgi:hypothetical protein
MGSGKTGRFSDDFEHLKTKDNSTHPLHLMNRYNEGVIPDLDPAMEKQ